MLDSIKISHEDNPILASTDRYWQILAKLTFEKRIFLITERFLRSFFITRFSEADQYLTWALTYYGNKVDILSEIDLSQEMETLKQVTNERYGPIIKENPPGMDTLSEKYDILITSNMLADNQSRSGFAPRFSQWDQNLNMLKLNPMADMSPSKLQEAIIAHEIPVHLTSLELLSEKHKAYEPKDMMLTSNLTEHVNELIL